MMDVAVTDRTAGLQSGKGHKDENFPVASILLKAEHRAPIMAFYRFARGADDVADHAEASPEEKLRLLSTMRDTLDGRSDANPAALALRKVMRQRSLDPMHAHDLLTAFERDVTIDAYPDWDGLMDYCRYSAMPVGRYVLDVHGESRSLWPANDALCAALQIINHLQDCGKDYHAIRRVYIPRVSLEATGASTEDLGRKAATPELRAAIAGIAGRTRTLLEEAAPFAAGIKDRRLGMEVAIIQRLAMDLVKKLETRDPLSERVHHRPAEAAVLALRAVAGYWVGRRA